MSDLKSDSGKREKEIIEEEYKDVFSDDILGGLSPSRGVVHQIALVPRAVLANRPAYRSSPEETKELTRQVENFLSKGYVRESISPYAVPVLLVPKKDGYVLSSHGLQVDQEKVKAIQQWPTARNASKLRSFKGLASFYRRFMKDFSTIDPLTNVIKKMNGFKWEEKQEKQFELLKARLSSAPLLALPNFNKMLSIELSGDFLGPSLRRISTSGKKSPHIESYYEYGWKRKVEFIKSIHAKVHPRKEHFPSQHKNKLDACGDGPFQVLEHLNDNSYRVDLPGEDSGTNLFKGGEDDVDHAFMELKIGPITRA
ncbi:hypothetical protein M9H77_08375 [Catharanthus roseus]|uniref:Uncharacterized protein n=1 Tax=Catharanthus roseus TaxID=4058 RepID=A0ACC0BXN3_CATRO|nr:hypothetical protein M9H77_08375 [Catharanthus roseus]